jgi:hypothetical protein
VWGDRVPSAAALRALPAPSTPPNGPLDAVIGMLLARAAPFDAATQQALRRQQGWGAQAPQPITELRNHARFQGTAALRRLTATPPPESLSEALRRLEAAAPCRCEDAAQALLDDGVTETEIHPGGVLRLARWYGLATDLRLAEGENGQVLVAPPAAGVIAGIHQVLTRAGRAGYADIAGVAAGDGELLRRLLFQVRRDPRLHLDGPVGYRVDDRSSALAVFVARMLVSAPGPLYVEEIHQGLQRAWRYRRQHLIASSALTTWISQQPWLQVTDPQVRLGGQLTSDQLRRATDRTTESLRATLGATGTATWQQLVRPLTADGMKPETAKIAVHTHPILVRVARNAYQVIGSR